MKGDPSDEQLRLMTVTHFLLSCFFPPFVDASAIAFKSRDSTFAGPKPLDDSSGADKSAHAETGNTIDRH